MVKSQDQEHGFICSHKLITQPESNKTLIKRLMFVSLSVEIGGLFSKTNKQQISSIFVAELSQKVLDLRQKDVSHLTTKPTKWHVCPANTQISLGIRQV